MVFNFFSKKFHPVSHAVVRARVSVSYLNKNFVVVLVRLIAFWRHLSRALQAVGLPDRNPVVHAHTPSCIRNYDRIVVSTASRLTCQSLDKGPFTLRTYARISALRSLI